MTDKWTPCPTRGCIHGEGHPGSHSWGMFPTQEAYDSAAAAAQANRVTDKRCATCTNLLASHDEQGRRGCAAITSDFVTFNDHPAIHVPPQRSRRTLMLFVPATFGCVLWAARAGGEEEKP